jgi:hypothetical protein
VIQLQAATTMSLRSIQAPLYEPLNPTTSEIRPLEISFPADDEHPQYTLSTVSLNDRPKFAALSYVWGDPTTTEDIAINGHTLPITKNLAGALRNVLPSWKVNFPEEDPKSVRLWADAVSVNQQDLQERSQQVQLMRSIYSSAAIVFHQWVKELTYGSTENTKFSLKVSTFKII